MRFIVVRRTPAHLRFLPSLVRHGSPRFAAAVSKALASSAVRDKHEVWPWPPPAQAEAVVALVTEPEHRCPVADVLPQVDLDVLGAVGLVAPA